MIHYNNNEIHYIREHDTTRLSITKIITVRNYPYSVRPIARVP